MKIRNMISFQKNSLTKTSPALPSPTKIVVLLVFSGFADGLSLSNSGNKPKLIKNLRRSIIKILSLRKGLKWSEDFP